jgi:hypothetical protein
MQLGPLVTFATLATLARSAACLAFVGSVVFLSSSACGTNVVGCDNSKCLAGNTCIVYQGLSKCRKACSSNTDTTTDCPFGYICKDANGDNAPFCVASTALTAGGAPLVEKPSGQWGAPCSASKGLQNPDCDGDQGFACYGTSPTDAAAYCTRYDCAKDDDCGPGFWCTKVNVTPDVNTANRKSFGDVRNVCLRRGYCATCATDVDCPTIAGTPQACLVGADNTKFCVPQCNGPGTCPTEAKCITVDRGALTFCYPRAQVCVGDGSLCAPCRSDADCGADGACLKGDYTTERSCGKKTSACTSCPHTAPVQSRSVGCFDTPQPTQPANYCFGIYQIAGQPSDIGCWSPDR